MPAIETMDNRGRLRDRAVPWVVLLGRRTLRPLLHHRAYPARGMRVRWPCGRAGFFSGSDRNLAGAAFRDHLSLCCEEEEKPRIDRLGTLVRQVGFCGRDNHRNPDVLRLHWYLRPLWALWNDGNVLHLPRRVCSNRPYTHTNLSRRSSLFIEDSEPTKRRNKTRPFGQKHLG